VPDHEDIARHDSERRVLAARDREQRAVVDDAMFARGLAHALLGREQWPDAGVDRDRCTRAADGTTRATSRAR
jgi:hypothetical protein